MAKLKISPWRPIQLQTGPNNDIVVNLNTNNRITETYSRVFNHQTNNLLNQAGSAQSSEDQHNKYDRRHLADRRRKTIRVLLERRNHGERRHGRPTGSTSDAEHCIDTTA